MLKEGKIKENQQLEDGSYVIKVHNKNKINNNNKNNEFMNKS